MLRSKLIHSHLFLALQPQPCRHYWSQWFGNKGKFRFVVELPSEQPTVRIYEINIEVHGCDDTAHAAFLVIPNVCRKNKSWNPNSADHCSYRRFFMFRFPLQFCSAWDLWVGRTPNRALVKQVYLAKVVSYYRQRYTK